MADPFTGEIRLLSFNFSPLRWLPCDGRTLAISDYDELYSLIGTIYGGDGHTTFNLPDLRGRIPIGSGTGPGLSPRACGNRGGAETVILTEPMIPSHSHTLNSDTEVPPSITAVLKCSSSEATSPDPAGRVSAPSPVTTDPPGYVTGEPDGKMKEKSVVLSGGTDVSGGAGGEHYNMVPYLVLTYCICTNGLYPSFS